MNKRQVIAAFGGKHGTPNKRLETAAAALGLSPRALRRWETDAEGRVTSPQVRDYIRARAFLSVIENAQAAGVDIPSEVRGLAED